MGDEHALHHRVHHAINAQYLDANYAGVLIIWDRMFGTFVPEDDKEQPRYGIISQLGTFNPFRVAFHEWAGIFARRRRREIAARSAAATCSARPAGARTARAKPRASIKAAWARAANRGGAGRVAFAPLAKPVSAARIARAVMSGGAMSYAELGEINYLCPYCNKRNIQTRAAIPYVRGYVLAYEIGAKHAVGCTSCVRVEIYKQSGLSLLIGWFSPVALFLNPVLISYGLVRGIFVFRNAKGVQRLLDLAGVPDPGQTVDVNKACYALAAAMVKADGKVDPEEVRVAIEVGRSFLSGFDEAEFRRLVASRHLPDDPHILAGLLRNATTTGTREIVHDYLVAIAHADGDVSKEERRLLDGLRVTLDLPMRVVA